MNTQNYRMSDKELERVSGGYVYKVGSFDYEIINDRTGEVMDRIETPEITNLLELVVNPAVTELMVVAKAMKLGQSAEVIGWDKVKELRSRRA